MLKLKNRVNTEKSYRERRLGQILGFTIGIAALGCGSWVAVAGAQLAGVFIGTGGVAGLVSVFVAGRTKALRKPDNSDKQNN